jgi:hypothetical protein
MALTGTIGQKLHLLLYILAEHKVKTNLGWKLKFAGDISFNFQSVTTDSPGFLSTNGFHRHYLTKYEGELLPQEMKEDLLLEKDPDETPYREVIWK